MNRNVRNYIVIGNIMLIIAFISPLMGNPENYFANMSLLVSIVVILFIAPTASYVLKKWDIHFHFEEFEDNIRGTLENVGETPFNFNRVQFVSNRNQWLFGKRHTYPDKGVFNDVEYHGADQASMILHDHMGCTIEKGKPITITVPNRKYSEYFKQFNKHKNIHLVLYYQGTNQSIRSQAIPKDIISNVSRQTES